MITKRTAMTINPSSPTLTAHDAGRVYAFRGLTLPAGASRECRAGYAEAEREMMAPKTVRVPVTLLHLFNGESTGRETKHRVRGAAGIHRLQVRESGDGWGVQVWMTKAAAVRLGVYVKDCLTLLACKDAPCGAVIVNVYGHDYQDPTVTKL